MTCAGKYQHGPRYHNMAEEDTQNLAYPRRDCTGYTQARFHAYTMELRWRESNCPQVGYWQPGSEKYALAPIDRFVTVE